MARFPVSSNQVQMSTATASNDTVQNGVLLDVLGSVVRVASSGGTAWQSGLRLTPSGQVVYVDATAGLPAGVQWVNGLPLASTGELCTSTSAVASWQNGIPFAANGAVCATGAALPALSAALTNWRSGGTYGKKVIFLGDSTTSGPSPSYAAIDTKFNAAYNTAGNIGDNLQLVNAGEIGVKFSNVMNGTSVFNINWLTAQTFDLLVVCLGINDVRDGSTNAAQISTMLTNLVSAVHTARPNANIILWTPNSFLSNDPTSSNYITPNISFAQQYTDVVWNGYNGVVGNWPTYVAHVDKQQVYGRVCQPGPTSLMQDVIHPDTNTGYGPSLPALATMMRPRGYPFTVAPTQDPFLVENKLTLNGDSLTPAVGSHTLTQTNGSITASGGWLVFSGGAAVKILDNLSDFLAGAWDSSTVFTAKLTIDIQMIPDSAAQPNGRVYVTNGSNIKIDNNADTTNTVDVSSFGSTILSSDQIVKSSRTDWSFAYGQGIASTYKNGVRTSKAFYNVDFNTGAGTLWIGQENTGWAAVVFTGQLRIRWTNENRYNHAPTIATYPGQWPTT